MVRNGQIALTMEAVKVSMDNLGPDDELSKTCLWSPEVELEPRGAEQTGVIFIFVFTRIRGHT